MQMYRKCLSALTALMVLGFAIPAKSDIPKAPPTGRLPDRMLFIPFQEYAENAVYLSYPQDSTGQETDPVIVHVQQLVNDMLNGGVGVFLVGFSEDSLKEAADKYGPIYDVAVDIAEGTDRTKVQVLHRASDLPTMPGEFQFFDLPAVLKLLGPEAKAQTTDYGLSDRRMLKAPISEADSNETSEPAVQDGVQYTDGALLPIRAP